MSAPADDQVRVSVTVAVPPAAAFKRFTEDIDRWWRRGLRFRSIRGGQGVLRLEPRVGGRVLEVLEDPEHPKVVEMGVIREWAPPDRLAFSWRASNFAPDESTEVVVSFTAARGGTEVTVTHRGWASIRPDHPVRHGQTGRAFIVRWGMWWGEQMSSFRRLVAGSGSASPIGLG